MAEITAALVKELREITGAGMMDCKKALVETSGDMEAAVDWLRKKGLAAAAKKAGPRRGRRAGRRRRRGHAAARWSRSTARPTSSPATSSSRASSAAVTKLALGGLRRRGAEGHEAAGRGPDRRRKADATGRHDRREHAAAPDGEAQRLATVRWPPTCTMPWPRAWARSACWSASSSTGDKAKLAALGKQLAMHVAAANPQALIIDAVDPAAVERERAILRRAGQGVRQAGRDHRQDGRRPPAQVL